MRSRIFYSTPTRELIRFQFPTPPPTLELIRLRLSSKTEKKYDSDAGFWALSTSTQKVKKKPFLLTPTLGPTRLQLRLQNWKKYDSGSRLRFMNILDSDSNSGRWKSYHSFRLRLQPLNLFDPDSNSYSKTGKKFDSASPPEFIQLFFEIKNNSRTRKTVSSFARSKFSEVNRLATSVDSEVN